MQKYDDLDRRVDSKLGLFSTDDKILNLNSDKLYEIFQGNVGNVEYFVELFNFLQKRDDVIKNAAECGCDPRDERKKSLIGDWNPVMVERRIGIDNSTTGSVESGLDNHGLGGGSGRYAVKQTAVEEGIVGTDTMEHSDGNSRKDQRSFPCGAHGCNQILTSLANFEAHYHRSHNFVCSTCRRSFVSNFLLDVHLEENHDSYFAVLCPRIDMYRCLVETCQMKCKTPDLRKDHLVSVHKFPSSFSFHQPIGETKKSNTGGFKSKNKQMSRNLHRQNQSKPVDSNCNVTEMETSEGSGDNNLIHNGNINENSKDSLTESSTQTNTAVSSSDADITSCHMDSYVASGVRMDEDDRQMESQSQKKKRIPAQICFGRGSQRAFNQRRGRGRGQRGRNWYQSKEAMSKDTTVDIENVDMNDLEHALLS